MFEKVKAAVELVKKSHPYATKYKGVAEDEALQTLVALATEYLQVSGKMPEEENNAFEKYEDMPYPFKPGDPNKAFNTGFNSARHSCILAIMGMIPSEDEIRKSIQYAINTSTLGKGYERAAQAIHTLLTNKIGGKG